jgi:L-fuculose-phosphate aldolase
MNDLGKRRRLIAVARAINEAGLNPGKAGNASVRVRGGFLVTPSAIPYARLRPADVVAVTADGRVGRGRRRPSSEWRLHRDVYAQRPDAGAVVHTHSPYATALACTGRALPAFHYMVAVAGGEDIRCAPYATFGTQALSDAALAALTDRRACLLANHGVVVLGDDPEAALALAVEVEFLARQYCLSLMIGGPCLLDAAEMARVLDRFRDYRGGGDRQ